MLENALLSVPPQRRPNWSPWVISFGAQCVAVLLLVQMGIVQPQKLLPPTKKIYTLVPLVSTPPPQRAAVRPPKHMLPPSPPLAPKAVAKLAAPTPAPQPIPAPPPVFHPVAPPRADIAEVAPPSPPKLQVVRTGAFGSAGSQAVPAVARPAREVQTGGFGDPNGIKGEGKPGTRGNIASVGSFDLPSGPGSGNGTGGARGVRGTVASVGFGNGIAIGNSDHNQAGGSRGAVQAGNFSDARVVETPRTARVMPVAVTSTAVQILSKPAPVYTDEARSLRIEGEVILEVTFAASGECHVKRVLRGLGHGLDEAGIRAAQQIRFRPATRNGQPVDSTASLHVVFQLAY
jgi:TonB family protein